MADFRSVQTRMWREDEWFDSLAIDARLFWIYLFTNPSSSPAGIYRLTMRTMANESGISYERACQLMEEFATAKKAYYSGGVVWVVNMRRLQFPDLDGSGAWQVATRMQADIDQIPTSPLKDEYLRRNGYPTIVTEMVDNKPVKRVRIQYGYGIDTQSVNKTKRNITETETKTSTSTKPDDDEGQSSEPAPTNGAASGGLDLDPDLVRLNTVWGETFAGTAFVVQPMQLPRWLDWCGVDVVEYMIGQAKDKQNPPAWLFTVFDTWRKDGEVAPAIKRKVDEIVKQRTPKRPVRYTGIDPITGEKFEQIVMERVV